MSSSTANAKAETIVKEGQTVPYAGVLVTEKRYRGYVESEMLADKLQNDLIFTSNQLDALQESRYEQAHEASSSKFNFFLSGIILGGLAGFLASK